MGNIINAWLSVWLYIMAAIGVVLSILVYKNRKKWDVINILCTLDVIVRRYAFLLFRRIIPSRGCNNHPVIHILVELISMVYGNQMMCTLW